jgi:7-cyano-7-deazaguanine reductase
MSKNSLSDRSCLRSIKNPSTQAYEIKIKNPEVTFEGVNGQPDFACAYITVYPDKNVIELKSLKTYFFQFRDKVLSYERMINVIYDDLTETYQPHRLRLVMLFNARGGISSKLCIDSDWKSRGGSENFKDWIMHEDTW